MLQMQFYASKLTKSQIERMLSNYKIKYTTLKTDLDAKINGMIQIFLKDILAFLENIEEIASEREKIQEYDRIKNELQCLNDKLSEKTKKEIELKNEINNLSEENKQLKERLNSSLRYSRNNSNQICSPTIAKTKTKKQSTSKTHINSYQEMSFSYTAKYKTSQAAKKEKRKKEVGQHSKRIKSFDKGSVDDFITHTVANDIMLTHDLSSTVKKNQLQNINNSYDKKDKPLIANIKQFTLYKKGLNLSRATSPEKDYDDIIHKYDNMLKDEIELLDNEEKNIQMLLNL